MQVEGVEALEEEISGTEKDQGIEKGTTQNTRQETGRKEEGGGPAGRGMGEEGFAVDGTRDIAIYELGNGERNDKIDDDVIVQ